MRENHDHSGMELDALEEKLVVFVFDDLVFQRLYLFGRHFADRGDQVWHERVESFARHMGAALGWRARSVSSGIARAPSMRSKFTKKEPDEGVALDERVDVSHPVDEEPLQRSYQLSLLVVYSDVELAKASISGSLRHRLRHGTSSAGPPQATARKRTRWTSRSVSSTAVHATFARSSP